MQIDYDSGEPVYLQIARLLRDQIIQGELQVGAQLPSGNEMPWMVSLSGSTAVSATLWRCVQDLNDRAHVTSPASNMPCTDRTSWAPGLGRPQECR